MFGNCGGMFGGNDGILFFILVFLLLFCGCGNNNCGCDNNCGC